MPSNDMPPDPRGLHVLEDKVIVALVERVLAQDEQIEELQRRLDERETGRGRLKWLVGAWIGFIGLLVEIRYRPLQTTAGYRLSWINSFSPLRRKPFSASTTACSASTTPSARAAFFSVSMRFVICPLTISSTRSTLILVSWATRPLLRLLKNANEAAIAAKNELAKDAD